MTVTIENISSNEHHGEGPLSSFSFPRTGKRGVPQQFPRRLYEMLDSETKSLKADPSHPKVIAWSDSGLAFRIFDVAAFSETILPKFFRTHKFSSFQRNLNLYGFAKVRRGADADMYAHPSFVREHPESLLQLRKTTPAQRRRMQAAQFHPQQKPPMPNPRSVSPHQHLVPIPSEHHHHFHNKVLLPPIIQHPLVQPSPLTVSPVAQRAVKTPSPVLPSNDRGKLDLLTFALEHEFVNRKI